ncbi:Protein NLRC5, partial [Stylophora pistillata]
MGEVVSENPTLEPAARKLSTWLANDGFNTDEGGVAVASEFPFVVVAVVLDDGELNIKVEVEDLKPKKPKVQTSTIATENGGSQGVQYQSAAATSSPTEGSVSHSGTDDLQALKTRVLCSIADNYLRETPPKSIEDHSRFQEHLRKMSVNITGFSVGSLLITVKCESLQILEELWTYYSSGHLGEIVQNCFATEKILEEMNLAELKLKTTIDIEEYKARKVYFERVAPRDISAVEESFKSDNPPENKRRRLTDNTAVVESCKSDDPSENKRRRPTDILAGEGSFNRYDSSNSKRKRVAEPLNVEKCREQLRSHYDTFSKVKTVPWNDSSSIPIDEIYTPLSWVRDERTPSGARQEELEDYTDMFKGNKHHRKPTRMLVYGRPGIGKSTFCKKIAYDWSKALKEILMKFYIFLMIKLRDVCDMKHIRDVLVASKLLAGDGPIAVESLHDYIINNQDKVLLVLDGYDEYSCVKKHSPILEIWRGEQLRDCHVIVTTRQFECDELTGPSHIQFEIHGFRDWKQIRAYAGKFLTSEQDVEKFTAYLKEKALKDLAEIPLLLMMLCRLWNDPPLDGLPTSRAGIYTEFIQTMLNHKVEREKSVLFQKVTSTEVREDLSILGKFAFDALLQGRLFVRCSELPHRISRTFGKLSEVGLFQIVNTTSLNPEKGAYFIHKSVQEFLAAWHMKEEVLSIKRGSMTSLSRLESVEKILKVIEVLKFACELSTEAASAVLHYFASVEKMGSWLDSGLRNLIQSTGNLFEQKGLLTLISHSYFCCSPERRRDLFSTFLSRTKGIMYLDSSQVNIVAKEHLLKSAVAPRCIFFSYLWFECSEQSYRDLITVAEDVNAVVGSSSGEKKAADFLRKHACRRQCDFYFLKISKIVLYIDRIISGEEEGYPFPTKMLRELVSSTAESTQEKRVCDRFQEHDKETASCSTESTVSITGPIPHSLSRLRRILVGDIARQEVETLTDILPLVSSLEHLSIDNVSGISDAQLMEALVSSIKYSERLHVLELSNARLTSRPTAAIARSLHQAPNLSELDLSSNPLGKGVSVLARYLSSCPDLWRLWLEDVKMTKEQMKDLSVAVRQNDIEVFTAYHDEKGNLKPEDERCTLGGIKIGPATDSEDEHESGSVSDLFNGQESGSDSDSDHDEKSG